MIVGKIFLWGEYRPISLPLRGVEETSGKFRVMVCAISASRDAEIMSCTCDMTLYPFFCMFAFSMYFCVHQGNIELIGTEFETRAAPVAEGQQPPSNADYDSSMFLFQQHILGSTIGTRTWKKSTRLDLLFFLS